MDSSAPAPLVSRSERRWVILFAVLVLLITQLPYLLGFARQGSDYRFTGFVIGVEDGNSYIAKMLSGMNGAWLFRTPYTAFPQAGALMFLPYILLGKLASEPGAHEQLVALYHLFRLGAGFLAIWASYDFLAFFVGQVRLRRLGLALVTLGGGLGWVLVLLSQDWWLGSLPLDFYSPETFGFLGLISVPHLALARALLLWALLAYLRFCRLFSAGGDSVTPRRAAGQALVIAGLWLLAGLVQPLTTLVIGFVIGLHTGGMLVWRGLHRQPLGAAGGVDLLRLVRWLVAAGVLPGLFVLYNVWLLFQDAYVRAWTAQNIIRSPNPLHYLVAYGLILPLAFIGGQRLLRSEPVKGWFLVGWVLSLPLLAYMPVNLQRRLPEGEWVAFVTLAMLALQASEQRPTAVEAQPRRRASLVGLVFAPLFFSTLLLTLGAFLQAACPALPAFHPRDEVSLFQSLARQSAPGQVVLAAYETGNALPAWAPLRVLVGHGPESANYQEINPQVAQFYAQPGSDIQRLALLNRWNVRYVFWGPAERRLGSWDPRQSNFLLLVGQSGNCAVFEVVVGVSQE
jgi:hypothetical protein